MWSGWRSGREFFHRAERGGTHVMLDSLRVDRGLGRGDADRAQETYDDVVAFVRPLRQPLAGWGERDWAVAAGLNESFGGDARDDAGDGDVADSHKASQVADAGFTRRGDQPRDRFHIILGGLTRVRIPRPAEAVGLVGRARAAIRGHSLLRGRCAVRAPEDKDG